jgi:hypothetical protein
VDGDCDDILTSKVLKRVISVFAAWIEAIDLKQTKVS